jgi:glycosyltransferase involved in cell wall biosynthesis
MHQYTADLANRVAQAGHTVHLVTTRRYPAHRYAPSITVHTPVDTRDSGFSRDAVQPGALPAVRATLRDLAPDLVHITGPHIWNVPIVRALRHGGVPTVHTLHDLDPHPGSPYGLLLHLWNWQVLRHSDHVMVHAVRYYERLRARGVSSDALTCTPLLHLFLGQIWLQAVEHLADDVTYAPTVLFFGRMERYKGVDHLLTAWALTHGQVAPEARLVLAGPGPLEKVWAGPLPPRVELRNHLIDDDEALELFKGCGLLALPYIGATQSALIPAAYFFRKPVLAAPSGALEEYVEDGATGWLAEPEHPASLARCLASALANLARLATMGTNGRAWYETRRQSEESTLLRMYDRLASKRWNV